MPPKKRSATGDIVPSREARDAATTTKRQRVSLACDGCRTAREKCDGDRPQCASCLSQNRSCSYTPASKKRGVRTGYLRAIELSLAWVLERDPACEEALYRLLTQDDASSAAGLITSRDRRAASRLHKRWTKSRVHREIGRLLSDGQALAAEASAEESDGEPCPSSLPVEQPQLVGPRSSSAARHLPQDICPIPPTPTKPPKQHPPLPELPSNWRRLIDIYVAYTHCWLPILDREALTAAATFYETQSLSLDPAAASLHAELWAAMAVAAFQDAKSFVGSSADPGLSPGRIFAIARSFVAVDNEADIAISTIPAVLLHVVVLIGRGSEPAASLLLASIAQRLAHLDLDPQSTSHDPRLKPVLAACFVLDTLTSLCLGQPLHWWMDPAQVHLVPVAEPPESNELWCPVYGFGHSSYNTDPSARPRAQPYLTLQQLSQLCQVLSAHMCPSSCRFSAGRQAVLEDLVTCLSPQFSFCGSLGSGEPTPLLPSAYLVKIMFLTATVALVPGHRQTLLSTFIETVESSISHFGTCGTPSAVVALLYHARKQADLDDLSACEKSRWDSARRRLINTWQQVVEDEDMTTAPTATNLTAQLTQDPNPQAWGSLTHDPTASSQHGSHEVYRTQEMALSSTRMHSADLMRPTLKQADDCDYSARLATPPARPVRSASTSFQPLPPGVGQPIQTLPASNHHAVDYGAIIGSLGTIECTSDGVGMDSQFMKNLGLSPGCNLGEMFQGDFGPASDGPAL